MSLLDELGVGDGAVLDALLVLDPAIECAVNVGASAGAGGRKDMVLRRIKVAGFLRENLGDGTVEFKG